MDNDDEIDVDARPSHQPPQQCGAAHSTQHQPNAIEAQSIARKLAPAYQLGVVHTTKYSTW